MQVPDLPKKQAVFIGVHHDDKGAPLFIVMGDDGEQFEVGTVDGVERLIASYREQQRSHRAAA